MLCAFVFWQSYVPMGAPPEWHAMDSFETLEACKAAVARSEATSKSMGLNAHAATGGSVYVARCLPDIVKP